MFIKSAVCADDSLVSPVKEVINVYPYTGSHLWYYFSGSQDVIKPRLHLDIWLKYVDNEICN